jgi:hypothetical protein
MNYQVEVRTASGKLLENPDLPQEAVWGIREGDHVCFPRLPAYRNVLRKSIAFGSPMGETVSVVFVVSD